jgi:hypothetical protein
LLSNIYAQSSQQVENINLPTWYLQNYDKKMEDMWKEYQPIALVAVLLSFMVASLLYGFGFILNNEKLKNYGMAEFLESAASLLMVVFFLTFLRILISTFFPVVAEGATPEQKQIVEIGPFTYLDARLALIQQISNKTFIQLANILYFLYKVSSVEIKVDNEDIGGIIKIIINTFITPLAEIADYMYSSLKALSFQRALLRFFEESALTVFLPLGVVLRIFPPTRGAGGMLIALAFSFFFVFPLTYLIFYLPYGPNSLYGVLMRNLAEINRKLDELNSSPVILALKYVDAAGIIGLLISIGGIAILILSNIIPIINLFVYNFPVFFFVITLIPLITSALTLTFVAILSDLFGENALTYGQRLIGRIL